MLILERRLNTAIRIGQDIRIKVLRTGASRALLGVEAPRSIPVWRDETPWRSESPASRDTPRKSLNVFVVEDDDDHAGLIRMALAVYPFVNVTLLATGEAAVRALDGRTPGSTGPNRCPDLLLLDLQLPGMSGLDVLRQIRSCHALRRLPVVILSCSKQDSDVDACMTAGANAFVSKAADYEQFSQSIYRIADFWAHARHVA